MRFMGVVALLMVGTVARAQQPYLPLTASESRALALTKDAGALQAAGAATLSVGALYLAASIGTGYGASVVKPDNCRDCFFDGGKVAEAVLTITAVGTGVTALVHLVVGVAQISSALEKKQKALELRFGVAPTIDTRQPGGAVMVGGGF